MYTDLYNIFINTSPSCQSILILIKESSFSNQNKLTENDLSMELM